MKKELGAIAIIIGSGFGLGLGIEIGIKVSDKINNMIDERIHDRRNNIKDAKDVENVEENTED